jgi:hypothetical protein
MPFSLRTVYISENDSTNGFRVYIFGQKFEWIREISAWELLEILILLSRGLRP